MSSNEVSQVTDEITQQNAKHEEIKKSIKKGGPYSKNDKDARRDEVYRLHFNYGYSARKLSDSEARTHNKTIRWVNSFMKRNNYSQRYMTFFDTISVSKEAREKIKKIIDEDRKRVN